MSDIKIEVYPSQFYIRSEKRPGYAEGAEAVPTIRSLAYYTDRKEQNDPNFPGRMVSQPGSGTFDLATDRTNAEIIGPIVLEFRPGFISIPGTPGIGAFVAFTPKDSVVDVVCPFGLVGFMSGPGI